MTRECGSCSLCCKVMGIGELGKAPGRWCDHFVRGVGCGAYGSRPGECRTFGCEWLLFEGWGPEWKPEKSRFVMITEEAGKRLKLVIDPAFPDVWRKEPYYSRLKHISKEAVNGRRVMIVIGARHIVIFPDADHDLGALPDKAQIISGLLETPMGLISFARYEAAVAADT